MTDRTIVVGIDGSAQADSAIRWAAAEAAVRDAGLRLVHAFVWPLFAVPLGASDVAPGLRAMADQVVTDASNLANKIEPGVPATAERIDGFPSPVLLNASEKAELIVIGGRGLGPMLGVLVGSTGLDLAAHARCPVVVVRPDHAPEAGGHVVVGYDGSSASRAAVDFAFDFAWRHRLVTRIVAVGIPDHEIQRLGPVAASDDPATELIQVSGNPAAELLRWSEDAQLLVVGSRGRGGFTGLLLGSVSQAVLHHGHCPVAVIPTAALNQREGH
jgi:nucleotide-binding universal stress UspA family protein